MPIIKRIAGLTITIASDMPPTLPLTVSATYLWSPDATPSARPTPGRVAVQISGGTVAQMFAAIRAAISAQETAADGGSHTIVEGRR